MLHFRLCALNTGKASVEALASWELSAFFRGSSSVEDLSIDKFEATDWYIDNEVPAVDRNDYRSELQMAEDEMLESLFSELKKMAQARAKAFSENYPFDINDLGHLTRKSMNELTPIGTSYLSLQFFRAFRCGLLEIDGANENAIRTSKDNFNNTFRSVFEFLAGYAVSSKFRGDPYMLSSCRSSTRLHKILSGVCVKISHGRVRNYNEWNVLQKNANDGGVDCLIHVGGAKSSGSSHLLLVGATVQEANIDTKIMGRDKREFFSTFFAEKPGAFQGALARPQDEDALTKDKCVAQDCLLFSYDDIWIGMADRAIGASRMRNLKRLDAKLRKLLRKFRGAVYQHEYEAYELDFA